MKSSVSWLRFASAHLGIRAVTIWLALSSAACVGAPEEGVERASGALDLQEVITGVQVVPAGSDLQAVTLFGAFHTNPLGHTNVLHCRDASQEQVSDAGRNEHEALMYFSGREEDRQCVVRRLVIVDLGDRQGADSPEFTMPALPRYED